VDDIEVRVVGCLVEKQRTTPDVYPLSLNSLRLACNQSTNRDPVVEYDEQTVVEALRRLALQGWTRLASGAGSRARKYRHLLDEALDLDDAEVSLLAVLMLRGAQTPGELKQRASRLHDFPDLAEVQGALERLVEAGHVERHPRRPGQKEDRYQQVLGGQGAEVDSAEAEPEVEAAPVIEAAPPAAVAEEGPAAPDGERLESLERQLQELRAQVAELRAALGE
jgi:uncharacterized protein YceH (UPF0502 family)